MGFEIHPEIPPEGRPVADLVGPYYERAKSSFRQMAAAEGLGINTPDIVPNTQAALKAAEFAYDHGRGNDAGPGHE